MHQLQQNFIHGTGYRLGYLRKSTRHEVFYDKNKIHLIEKGYEKFAKTINTVLLNSITKENSKQSNFSLCGNSISPVNV